MFTLIVATYLIPKERAALRVVPITIKQADKLVKDWHRHHQPRGAHRWSIGVEVDGELVGAAIIERPKARMTEQYRIAEVSRLVTNGFTNACSKLYSAAARIAKEMGYDEIQTSILESEIGTSLKASGWKFSHISEGGDWNRPSRGKRRTDQPQCKKQVWKKILRAASTKELAENDPHMG